jgi:hypothetical protein
MPKRLFSLEEGKEKRLIISWKLTWKLSWKKIEITFDNRNIGTIPDQKSLINGQIFKLPDNSEIKVQKLHSLSYGLSVSRNGQPLPESDDNPINIFKNTYQIIYFFAILNIVIGCLSVLKKIDILQQIEYNYIFIIIGIVFLMLGYLVQRRSLVALFISILIMSIGSIIEFCFATMGLFTYFSYIVMQILFIVPLIQGIEAIKRINEDSKQRPTMRLS